MKARFYIQSGGGMATTVPEGRQRVPVASREAAQPPE